MNRSQRFLPGILILFLIVFMLTALPVYGYQSAIMTPDQGVFYDEWVSVDEATRWYTFDTTNDMAAMLVM